MTKFLVFCSFGKAKEKYKGKQVVIFDGKAYILPENDQEAASFVAKLREKKPKTIPILTFVPREETYILHLKAWKSLFLLQK